MESSVQNQMFFHLWNAEDVKIQYNNDSQGSDSLQFSNANQIGTFCSIFMSSPEAKKALFDKLSVIVLQGLQECKEEAAEEKAKAEQGKTSKLPAKRTTVVI